MSAASDSTPGDGASAIVVSAGAVAWAAVAAVFVLLRLGPVWQAPVGGMELDHLAGAWQAHLGVDDSRFAGTAFQWLATATFAFTSAPEPARVIAFLAACTIPGACYLLRSHIGEGGALVALAVLAFEGPVLHLSAAASASGFDLPIAIWLFVFFLHRDRLPAWSWGVASAALVLGGPVALPLAAAAVSLLFLWGHNPPLKLEVATGVGVVAGVLVASIRPGWGFEGIVVPPFDLLADGFERDWSSSTVADIAVLYELPVIVLGAAAAIWLLRPRPPLDSVDAWLLAWSGIAALWFLGSLGSNQAVPNAALALPLALTIGRTAPGVFERLADVDWGRAAPWLAGGVVATSVVYFAAANGAVRTTGASGFEITLMIGGALGLASVVSALALDPSLRYAILGYLAAAGICLVALGGFGVALSGRSEPLPSPVSTAQAGLLRDIALETREQDGGPIVVHPDLRDEITWPFRDSGIIRLESRAPDDAAILIWRAELPQPEGYVPLQGSWALVERVEPPTGSLSGWLRWLGDPNSSNRLREGIAVYVRFEE